MKYLALFLGVLVLSACSQVDPLPVPSKPVPDVTRCRPGVPQSPAPPLPRTTNSIITAYNKAKEAGLATEAALRECSAKVDLLLDR